MSSEQEELEKKLASLLALVKDTQNPNINPLWLALKDIEAIKLNIKFFGYELARTLKDALPVTKPPARPGIVGLKSKPSTQADMESTWVAYWLAKLGLGLVYHRKLWECCYVLQALFENGALFPGKRGLGFGCGQEPVPSLMAALGVYVTITDLEPEAASNQGWLATSQHTTSAAMCFRPNLIDEATFNKMVRLEYADMNAIPAHFNDYDFCWSICALEHLGSIAQGLSFVENSLNVLAPGGVAVHTTEFNFSNDNETVDNWPTVLFQSKHFRELAYRLRELGHTVAELDFDIGGGPMDKFIDLPPFVHDFKGIMLKSWSHDSNHLKINIDGFPSTCFGLIIKKGA
jgi:hypothetical protein